MRRALVAVLLLFGCTAPGREMIPPGPPDLGTPLIPDCSGGEENCFDGVAHTCDNGRWVEFECDSLQGLVCEPGGCRGECTPHNLGYGYTGCDYFPTVTANRTNPDAFHFAVSIANASEFPTTVTLSRGPDTIETRTVAPGAIEIVTLPWIPELKGPWYDFSLGNGDALFKRPVAVTTSAHVVAGAYRLRSNRPVSVYQFNALEYINPNAPMSCALDSCFSYSNDASLLLPVNALGDRYVVTSYHSYSEKWIHEGDFVTVTAVVDDTEISYRPTANVLAGPDFPAVPTGGLGTIHLNRGDVVQLHNAAFSSDDSWSGARVWSPNQKAFQVISGVPCANVPTGNPACDHLEQTVLPVQSWGKRYVVAPPRAPAPIETRVHTLRLQGVEADTVLTFDPPSFHDPITLAERAVVELVGVSEDFVVSSTKPFAVGQFMHGAGGEGSTVEEAFQVGAGDPSQSIVVPSEQFRKDYVFLAPNDYDANFINVVAPSGEVVTLDGVALAAEEFVPVGDGSHSVARHLLDRAQYHRITSESPFGITVYGYGSYTSYMYPGGLDLERIYVR